MFNFKKIASVLTSAVMLSSTIGFAAAASYPTPFVSSGTADGAVVYGANAAISDVTNAINVQQKLGSLVTSGSSGSGPSSTGEVADLYTSSSPLFLNNTLRTVRDTLAASDLPTILADGTFDGTSSVQYTQRLYIGSNQIDFAKQPSDSDDPQIGISLGTNAQTNFLYNATVAFDSAINFSHADSVGEDLDLFGQKFTVGAATTASKLVLFKSSEKISLSTDNPTADVTIDGSTYTVELVSASDSAATIKVTDSAGNSDQKEISEASSKKLQGLEVAVDTADETNLKLSASVSVGSSRITLQNGVSVKVGTDEDILDGTHVVFLDTAGTATASTHNISKIQFMVAVKDSQTDAVVPGESYVDPIFGTLKTDFSGISIPLAGTDREEILVKNSGSDKMIVTLQSHDGTEPISVTWVYNNSAAMDLSDSDSDLLVTAEKQQVNQSGYVVLANDKEGGLYEVTQITNSSSSSASDDSITLRNVLSGKSSTFKADSEGTVTATEQGKTYTLTYTGASTSSNSKAMQVRVNYPESSGQAMILYPTIVTSKGAKLAFYEPVTITNLTIWDGTNALTDISVPDGDGYTSVTSIIKVDDAGVSDTWNFTSGGSTVNVVNTSLAGSGFTFTSGRLTYTVNATGTQDQVRVRLVDPAPGIEILRPALIIFEEKDDSSNYEALVVTLDAGYDGDSAGIGVGDVIRTWGNDNDLGNEIRLESNNDLYQDVDFWGTLTELNKGDSDQTTARISYPDNQVVAYVAIAEESASITPCSTSSGSGGQVMIVKDTEVTSVAGKNFFVVVGSCINMVAAKILGSDSPLCTSAFTEKTGVGVGQYIIKSVVSPYSDSKTALLVAGYESADTENAVKKVLEGAMTDIGTQQVYQITSA